MANFKFFFLFIVPLDLLEPIIFSEWNKLTFQLQLVELINWIISTTITIDNNEMQKRKKIIFFFVFFCTQIFVFHLLLLSFVVCLVSMVSIHHSFIHVFFSSLLFFFQLSHTFVGINQETTNLKMTSDKQNKIVLLMDRHNGVAKRLFFFIEIEIEKLQNRKMDIFLFCFIFLYHLISDDD